MTRRIGAVILAGIAAATCTEDGVGPASDLSVAGGDGQSGLVGLPLPDSLVVRVVDARGEPVPDQQVSWTALGDDSVAPRTSVTDADGIARTLRVLGPAVGTDTVLAELDPSRLARFAATGELATPGTVYQGRRGYVSYTAGALPVILSAPHGGTLEPSEIPDRTSGTQVRDLDTDLLALAVATAIENRLGARPHVILSHLHRRKLDPNRSIAEAAEGDPLAEQAWLEFHGFIEHASARVVDANGAGLVVDVHGHGHDIHRLELGYLLDATALGLDDAGLDDPTWAASSSVRALAARLEISFPELLRGNTGLGTLFEAAGVPAVPSQAQPDPGTDPYFSGGYITLRHGSRDGGAVDAIQLECHRVGIRDSPANRAAFGVAAAEVLETFLATHYGFTFGG